MKYLKLLLLFFLLNHAASAQDHIYSQFYNAPNYLNPALNGQFNGDLRINMIYRNQWANLPEPMAYYSVGVDYNVPRFGGGFGLLVTRSTEGTAYLQKTNLSGIYSYSVDFDNAVLSFGLQGGMTNRQLDYGKLVFADQIDPSTGIIPGGSSATIPEFNNRFYFDSGAGINLVLGNLMVGASAQHINRPNESFPGSESQLPIRSNGYASYRLALDRNDDEDSPALIPSVVYYRQSRNSSLSAGFQYKFKSVNAGAWYRGDKLKGDAFVVSVIFDVFVKRDYYDKVRLGASHDATSSKLSYGKTAGSTELALSYETTFPNRTNGVAGGGFRSGSGKRCYDFY